MDDLPPTEQRILQGLTITGIVVVVYLFFVAQRIITAMIVGALLLGAQKAWLHFRKKRKA